MFADRQDLRLTHARTSQEYRCKQLRFLRISLYRHPSHRHLSFPCLLHTSYPCLWLGRLHQDALERMLDHL